MLQVNYFLYMSKSLHVPHPAHHSMLRNKLVVHNALSVKINFKMNFLFMWPFQIFTVLGHDDIFHMKKCHLL
jgi:hypothetical protein